MSHTGIITTLLTVAVAAAPAAAQSWVDFDDETATRFQDGAYAGAIDLSADLEEKDYAWGDVDGDCDVDLILVRKEPFTTTGKRTNVLLMNENGVLVDRTDTLAQASDVPGDLGFLTPTNDRDVVLVDVDLDGDLDIVTAPTLSDFDPPHLKNPRVYINRLVEGGGDPGNCGPANAALWAGFVYQGARVNDSGLACADPDAGPRFCAVSAGDVNGDGYPDLYFTDYDNSVLGGDQFCDFNNRLLINQGAANPGFFTDETASRLTVDMTASEFGAAGVIADMNNDGALDIVKHSALVPPYQVALLYNNPLNEGVFNFNEEVFNAAPYFVSVGDLNNDGAMDLVVTDDAADRYLMQTGLNGQGRAVWLQQVFPDSDGFGGNSIVADLDGDGWNDVLVTDVDVDVPGCGGRLLMQRNLGTTPGEVPTFVEDNPLPLTTQIGVHDVAVFDIDGDGYNDMVVGRCTGTQVWMNQPIAAVSLGFPGGVPTLLDTGATTALQMQATGVGLGEPDDATAKLHYRVNGALPYTVVPMTVIDAVANVYGADLPAQACTDVVDFYVSIDEAGGETFLAPVDAPATAYRAVVADGLDVTLDDFEEPAEDWVIQNNNLQNGFTGWEQADPNVTVFNATTANPEVDASPGDGVQCFITGHGAPGEGPLVNDVDGGPVYLISPSFDVSGSDATVSFARYLFSQTGVIDALTVDVSNNNGFDWTPIPELTTFGTVSAWETVSFIVSDHVTPTSTVRVRFGVADFPNDSVTEAGIDEFRFERLICDAGSCEGDTNEDGMVDIDDVINVILDFGTDGSANNGDVDGSGLVDIDDVVLTVLAFGPVPRSVRAVSCQPSAVSQTTISLTAKRRARLSC